MSRMTFAWAAASAVLLSALPASAQAPPKEGYAGKFIPMTQSLTDLLDAGWSIVTTPSGLGPLGFILTRQGKWAICIAAGRPDEQAHILRTGCVALN